MVYLEFETDVVIEDALQRARDRVNRAKPEMPEDVSDTDVSEISFADMPILIVTIAGPVDEVVLKKLGEDLKDKLDSFAIGHGTFSLLDAFPYQWCEPGFPAACALSVSIPVSERLFGQGVRAHFDNFVVTTETKGN